MKVRLCTVMAVLLLAYSFLMIPFVKQLNNRPVAVRLGFMPHAKVLKAALADYQQLVAQHAVVRVLFYFGTLIDPDRRNVNDTPDFFHMFTTLQQAVRLDPYNLDAYYFTQAAFTWELKKIKEVNDMLDHGMEFRTWDAQLPFYAGMNAAIFLKDYKEAARYMKIAATRSADPLYSNLTARYFYESGHTKIGLAFIEQMEKNTFNFQLKKLYRLRREALQQVVLIEDAVVRYRKKYERLPADLGSLVMSGFLANIPRDPYGGLFYLTADGSVRSTSKFAMMNDSATDTVKK